MSARDFSDGWGYDVISPYDEIPITFEQSQLSRNTMLLSRNEYPVAHAAPTKQLDTVTQKSVTNQVLAPPGMIEAFVPNLNAQDQQWLLIFLLIVVAVMQVRIMWQLDDRRSAHPFAMHQFPRW